MEPFKHEIQKKKWDKLRKRIWLSRGLCTIGGALICGGIIVPIMLTQCNKTKPKQLTNQSTLDIIGLTELLIPFKTSYEYKCNISDATIKAVDLPSGFSFNGHTLKTPNSIADPALTFKLIATTSWGLICTRTISCFQNDSNVPENKIILIEGDVKNYYLEYVDVSVADDTLTVSLTDDQKNLITGVYFSNITISFSKIGNDFFTKCGALTSIDLSALTNVIQIGDRFLGNCNCLISVDLSEFTNVKKIGDWFLYAMPLLTSIDLSALTNVEEIGDNFIFAPSLTSIDLSGLTKVEKIEDNFLYACYSLTSADFSGFTNVKEIGNNFLSSCYALTSIDLSAFTNVIQIGDNFLNSAWALRSIDLSAFTNVKQIGIEFLLRDPVLASIDLSALTNVEQIGDDFIRYCEWLVSVNLSGLKNVQQIGDNFLSGCKALTSVTVGDNNSFSSITTPSDIMSDVTNISRNKIFGSEAQAFKDWVGDAIDNWEVAA